MPRKGERKRLLLDTEERDERICALRRKGTPYRAIAKEIGCSVGTAHAVVTKRLDELAKQTLEHVEGLRAQESERLDVLQASLWGAATDEESPLGDRLKATDRIVRVLERRARLLGLDAPTKIAPTTPDGDAPYQAPAPDLSKLSVDELRQLRSLRAKIDNNDTEDGAEDSG